MRLIKVLLYFVRQTRRLASKETVWYGVEGGRAYAYRAKINTASSVSNSPPNAQQGCTIERELLKTDGPYVDRTVARVVTNVVNQRHQIRQGVRSVGRFGKQSDRLRPMVQIRFEHQQSGFDRARQESRQLVFTT